MFTLDDIVCHDPCPCEEHLSLIVKLKEMLEVSASLLESKAFTAGSVAILIRHSLEILKIGIADVIVGDLE